MKRHIGRSLGSDIGYGNLENKDAAKSGEHILPVDGWLMSVVFKVYKNDMGPPILLNITFLAFKRNIVEDESIQEEHHAS